LHTPNDDAHPEETMNAQLNLSLLPSSMRFAIAVAVALVLSMAWIAAEHESHDAVVVAGTSIKTTHVRLPMVEVIGRRAAMRTNA
jgi:hypothetical protein